MFAPVLTFKKLFEAEGVPVTDDEVRGPMGVHKRVGEDIDADTYRAIRPVDRNVLLCFSA